jgi:hypothetical protein
MTKLEKARDAIFKKVRDRIEREPLGHKRPKDEWLVTYAWENPAEQIAQEHGITRDEAVQAIVDAFNHALPLVKTMRANEESKRTR